MKFNKKCYILHTFDDPVPIPHIQTGGKQHTQFYYSFEKRKIKSPFNFNVKIVFSVFANIK